MLLFLGSLFIAISCYLQSFVGHGDSVNEIRTQAMKPALVVSASKVSAYFFIVFVILHLTFYADNSGPHYYMAIYKSRMVANFSAQFV